MYSIHSEAWERVDWEKTFFGKLFSLPNIFRLIIDF